MRIDFAGGQPRRINEIDVYTLRDGFSTKTDDPTIFETFSTADNTGEGMTDYDVYYLSGNVWRTIPGGKVTANNKVRRQFRFSPITANAIGVAVNKGANYTTFGNNWSRLVEIEAWENAAAPDDVMWVEDALPAGAVPAGAFEGWNWTCFNPLPLSGTLAHTSEIVGGVHQHYFYNATQTLTVNAGDTLVAHVYLDPANPPTSVMLQWNDGTWEHRAYWGANQFPWGVDGTVSRRNMGALPPTGQWVRLEVPASLVGLEGRTLNGMAFSLVNGRATWDRAGKYAGAAPVQPTISINDVTVTEGNSGTTLATFTVTLSSTSSQTISVNYATANGTVCNASDYVAASGTVTFTPNQTSRPISIQVVGDTVPEPNETFVVDLSGPVNATLTDNQGTGTIVNDDSLPQLGQPIKYFGYVDATEALSTVNSYTNFTYIGAEYNKNISDTLRSIQQNGLRAIVDLSAVLWCPPDASFSTWRFCPERWEQWLALEGHSAVLNDSHVLAFTIFNEASINNVRTDDLEKATELVNKSFCGIPTLVIEFYGTLLSEPNFRVPSNVDWIALDGYQIHPNLDFQFTESIRILKEKKQSWQRTVYALDAFYGEKHCDVALTAADMDTIAQEWYTYASRDPDAIAVGAFLWGDLGGEGGIGSRSFPQNVRDKHKAIGEAIIAGRVPTYQGAIDSLNCQSLAGWAWDASQPNTPISVDIYDGEQKIVTVRANQSSLGIGNGQHGFTFNLSASVRNGQTHSIAIKYSGLKDQLPPVHDRSLALLPLPSMKDG